jgi:hypothetical protein
MLNNKSDSKENLFFFIGLNYYHQAPEEFKFILRGSRKILIKGTTRFLNLFYLHRHHLFNLIKIKRVGVVPFLSDSSD